MRLSVAHNPFAPDIHDARCLLPGESIAAALEREGLDGRYVVQCNGELLSPERGMEYVPADTDAILVAPALGNSALKTIALIGVSAATAFFTAGLGSFIGGVLFTSLTTTAQNAIAATIISVGGSMLVNGIASFFQKQPGGTSMGVLGPQTVARSGIPIPKGYGKIRRAGNIVESWIDIQGDNEDEHDVDDGADTIGRQYINCRIDFGWGPARNFTDFEINGKDINSFRDVAYLVLPGTNDQLPVISASDPRWVVLNPTTTGTTTNTEPTTAFNTINNNYPQDQRVCAGIPVNYVIVPGQRPDTQKATVFVVFKQGCWRYDDNMEIKRLAIDYSVYYRVKGSGDAAWVLAQHHVYVNIRQTLLRQATIIDNLPAGSYDYKVLKTGSGAPDNPLDLFEHESNLFGDELWIESVQETSYTALSYPMSIQVLLRIMASDQISGADLNLTCIIEHGLTVTMEKALPAPIAALAEDVPAAVGYDILSSGLIGGNIPDSRIDLAFLTSWAALSSTLVDDGDGGTQPLALFNGVYDQPDVNVWAALQTCGGMSRANFQRVGVRVTGWLDQPDVPVQLFHVGNILKDSYTKTYLNLEDRAQEIEVTFPDAADDYKTRNPIRVVAAQDETSDQALKQGKLTLVGCTDRVQAYYFATHKLLESETVIRTHTWRSNAQAIRCKTGNLALLQHDVPQWGYGGLVQPGSTASMVNLDRDDFDSSGNLTVTVSHPALQRAAIVIQAIAGNVITVTGYDGSTSVTRLQQGTVDVAVTAALSGGVTVSDSTGLVAGPATLWDLDVMETRAVASLKGAVALLTTPLSAVPVDYASYVLQSAAKQAITVRIKRIQKSIDKQTYTITAVDYSPSTYAVPPPMSGLSYTPPAPTSTATTATPLAPNPAATGSDANLSVAYTESETDNQQRFSTSTSTYRATSIAIQAPGSGYTSSSVFQMVSDYNSDDSDTSGHTTVTHDPTVTLSVTLDANGGVATITGGNTVTWHEIPYVMITR